MRQSQITVLVGMTLVFAIACGSSRSGDVLGTGGIPGGTGTGGIGPGSAGSGGAAISSTGGSSSPGTGGNTPTKATGSSPAGAGGSTQRNGSGGVGGGGGLGHVGAGEYGGDGNNAGETCAQIVSDYAVAEIAARKCTLGAADQCEMKAALGLGPCEGCREYVNDATTLSAIAARWTARGCSNQTGGCAVACGALAASTCTASTDTSVVASTDGVCTPGR